MPDPNQLPRHTAQHIREASDQDGVTGKRIRLHITPLDSTLLQTYISPSLLLQSANISYHTIETCPERIYGYIELPAMEAEKLKKKLNGTTLKGTKVRVEEAKPKSRKRKIEHEAEEDTERPGKSQKRSSKKSKREEDVLPGVDLPQGRKVKRGWTEARGESGDKERKRSKKENKKDGKKEKREKSKYTKESELLFKAKLPPNKAHEPTSKDNKKKKNKKKDETVVHEFSKTRKHKHRLGDEANIGKNTASHYEEGMGWLGVGGELIEPEPKSRKQKVANSNSAVTPGLNIETGSLKPENKQLDQPRPKSSGSMVSEYLQSPGTQLRGELNQALAGAQSGQADDSMDDDGKEGNSESEPEVSDGSDEELESNEDVDNTEISILEENRTAQGKISDPDHVATAWDEAKSVIERNSPQASPTKSLPDQAPLKEIHPLEALYKRPKPNPESPKKPTPIQTNFKFFDPEEDEENDKVGALPTMPQTPFTRQDLEFRGIRSAAPTPDTAAIGKRFSFPWADDQEDEDEDKGEEEEAEASKRDDDGDVEMQDSADPSKEATKIESAGAKTTMNGEEEPKQQTEFEKWFWEHRGETNRAWKKRRREAMKEKRHRENRRLNRRIV